MPPQENNFTYNLNRFEPLTPTLLPQTPHFSNHRRWCQLANTLQIQTYTVKKRTAEITTSGIAIVSKFHGYSIQRRTIGFVSATAGLLVKNIAKLSDE